MRLPLLRSATVAAAVGLLAVLVAVVPSAAQGRPATVRVPDEDRFVPLAATIHVGDTVRFVNTDTDDHTVVSDDAFNTAGHRGADYLIRGTENNGGTPGEASVRFTQVGTFVYYCRFHAHLDEFGQPAFPGPDGGIEGTPMMGIVTVLP